MISNLIEIKSKKVSFKNLRVQGEEYPQRYKVKGGEKANKYKSYLFKGRLATLAFPSKIASVAGLTALRAVKRFQTKGISKGKFRLNNKTKRKLTIKCTLLAAPNLPI